MNCPMCQREVWVVIGGNRKYNKPPVVFPCICLVYESELECLFEGVVGSAVPEITSEFHAILFERYLDKVDDSEAWQYQNFFDGLQDK